LREETLELEQAIVSKDKESIVKEAADVANFAMMIADNSMENEYKNGKNTKED
jgi:NTP pyrophosphatase (non-canonical NTP hydrolase)